MRQKQLAVLVSSEQERKLDAAALMAGLNRSAFVRSAAMIQAEKVLSKRGNE